MKVIVKVSTNFKKEVKPLLKKYRSLSKELAELKQLLLSDPKSGVSLGNNAYKIRIKISSKGKGKAAVPG